MGAGAAELHRGGRGGDPYFGGFPPHPTRMRLLLLLTTALALTGCDSALTDAEGFSVALLTDGDAYAPGATARLTVENRGTVPIEFGPPSCYATLEAKRTEGVWALVARGEARVCPDVEVVLPPGESGESPISLDVVPGTYRIRLDVSENDDEEEVRLTTEPFVVG